MQRKAFLKEAEGLWPVAKGSLAEVAKPCIRPSCPACRRGEKHPAFLFTYRKAGKQRCLYVPRALVPEMRRAIANGRRLERRLVSLGEALIFTHRRGRVKPKAP
jgi:hypothetical protein